MTMIVHLIAFFPKADNTLPLSLLVIPHYSYLPFWGIKATWARIV